MNKLSREDRIAFGFADIIIGLDTVIKPWLKRNKKLLAEKEALIVLALAILQKTKEIGELPSQLTAEIMDILSKYGSKEGSNAN